MDSCDEDVLEEDGDEEDEEDKEEHDDEDNDGGTDNDLLTLVSGPFSSSFQAAELSEKMFRALICGAFNKAFFNLISFFNSSRGRLP